MLKTYLYIPDSLEEKISRTARVQKRSKRVSVEVLFKIAELGKKNKVKGPKDAVARFDEYLYVATNPPPRWTLTELIHI